MDEMLGFGPEKFRCATWNINQAKREENYEDTRFDNRWPKILEYIKEVKPDVFALQELRNLETSKISLPQLLFEISQLGYDHKHAYYNETKFSFALAIFYDRSKFFVRNHGSTILPTTPNGNDHRQLLMVELISIKSKLKFWFATTHLSMEEDEKAVSVNYIVKLLSKMIRNNDSFLCAGDFNFFDDLDGKTHRAVLENVFPDVAYPLKNASGTFMGYAHDPNAKKFDEMSRLDHIFCGSGDDTLKCEQAMVHGDLQLVKDRKYPSDHLMIVLDFELSAPRVRLDQW